MDAAKIRLSTTEMELVSDGSWILTKNSILGKVTVLLGDILQRQNELLPLFRNKLPPEIFAAGPKISKGENYKGLPYQVLDHPRYFDKQNKFAVRTMFWWGHYFSVTLHLSGSYKNQFAQKLFSGLSHSGLFIAVQDNEWEHAIEPGNYALVETLESGDAKNIWEKKEFLKLAQKIPLKQWDNAVELATGYFYQFMQSLTR